MTWARSDRVHFLQSACNNTAARDKNIWNTVAPASLPIATALCSIPLLRHTTPCQWNRDGWTNRRVGTQTSYSVSVSTALCHSLTTGLSILHFVSSTCQLGHSKWLIRQLHITCLKVTWQSSGLCEDKLQCLLYVRYFFQWQCGGTTYRG